MCTLHVWFCPNKTKNEVHTPNCVYICASAWKNFDSDSDVKNNGEHIIWIRKKRNDEILCMKLNRGAPARVVVKKFQWMLLSWCAHLDEKYALDFNAAVRAAFVMVWNVSTWTLILDHMLSFARASQLPVNPVHGANWRTVFNLSSVCYLKIFLCSRT